MNKELNHDQISSVDQIYQFKWTVRVLSQLSNQNVRSRTVATFKHGGKFGQSFGPGPGFRFGLIPKPSGRRKLQSFGPGVLV